MIQIIENKMELQINSLEKRIEKMQQKFNKDLEEIKESINSEYAITEIKSTMRYHLMLVTMAAIKKSTNNKCWRGCREKGTLLHCWWECKLVQPLWKTVWTFLKKLENRPAL